MSEANVSENTSKGSQEIRLSALRKIVENSQIKTNIPDFKVGDTVKVHAKIKEGGKERVQVFEGVVIRRSNGNTASATFTVRKISYSIGVERTFFVHSPMIEKIQIVAVGQVRRAKLYYLRDLRGKAARIKSKLVGGVEVPSTGEAEQEAAQ